MRRLRMRMLALRTRILESAAGTQKHAASARAIRQNMAHMHDRRPVT